MTVLDPVETHDLSQKRVAKVTRRIVPVAAELSVSQIVLAEYGTDARPGVKGECPFCHHETFSIKRDDSLGKCFHPSCGRFITRSMHGVLTLACVLESVFYDFHKHLLSLKDLGYNNAYTYLVEERGIHPDVVNDSMLGTVPPMYDLDAKFQPLLEKAQTRKESSEKRHSRNNGSGKQGKIEPGENSREFIVQVRDNLKHCIEGHTGWICFFYTDCDHRIVAIRFRQSYSKNIVYFKPHKSVAGLFGHGLFTPFPSERLEPLNEQLIVTEGEFNQLQLQSLCLRYQELQGKPKGYVYACAVGGVTNADYDTIRKIAKNPIIFYDNDSGRAGFSLVEKARQHISVRAFTTPKPDSDLDDFIRSFGNACESAWEALRSLLSQPNTYARDHEAVAKEIAEVRRSGKRDFEINKAVSEIVLGDLQDQGSFFHDSHQFYFFNEADKKLVALQADDNQYVHLLNRYGINPSEPISRYITDSLRGHVFTNGEKVQIHKLAYYDKVRCTHYLFDHGNAVYRITPDKIEKVDNGTDGILFLANPEAQPFKVHELEGNSCLLEKVIVSKINFASDHLTPEEQAIIFRIWLLSLFFESIMPTKPILAFIGPKGSGKSITLRKVGMLIFGKKFNVMQLPDDPKDFEAAVTNEAFVAIDNADSKCHWLNDRIATMATGGTIKKRELYTTNRLVQIPIRCFLAITSRNPHFRRDDVADRLLIMKVERIDVFEPENDLLDEVIQHRDPIMSELALCLQTVVRALRDEKDNNYSGSFRMADFADFALKAARNTGSEQQVKRAFARLAHVQSTFTLEDDPTFELLEAWVDENPGREITNKDLCAELDKLAIERSLWFPYKDNPRGLAQYMKNLRSNLEGFFTIKKRTAGGRKQLFSYKRRSDEEKP